MSTASDVPALTTAGFQVLLALASGHSHGYAVMGFVDQLTDGQVRLGPGTLYRTLARLVADELVDAPADRRFKLGLRALLDGLQLESSKKRKRASR